MNNVVFNAQTLEVVGVNRPALPYEFKVQTMEGFNPVKLVKDTDKLVPKRDALGNKLYWDGDKEVTYNLKPTKFEETVETRKHVGEDGVVREQEYKVMKPTNFEALKAVMIPANKLQQINFREHLSRFTYEEVVAEKKKLIERNSLNKILYYNEDLKAESFSTTLSNFSADLGNGFIALHPKGQIRTVKLTLPKAVQTIEVYAEVQDGVTIEVGATASDFVDVNKGLVTFPAPTNEVYVRFNNTTDKGREIHAFGLLG